MSDSPQYLTLEEAEQIIDQFETVTHSSDRLLVWTGLPRDWVQQWADDYGMLTLTSVMGPLMNNADQRCLRRVKNRETWSKYVKGASGIFARYACRRGIVRVLTLPPSWAEFLRPESSYRTIEEPVLKGTLGYRGAVQINTVHLLAPLVELEYQTWPENRIPESLRGGAADSLNFRLPPWIRKAAKKAADSLRSNALSCTACPSLKPAGINLVLQGSVRKPGKSQIAKRSKGCKQSGSHANAKASLQPQSQKPQNKKQQPQCKQPQSKKKQQPQNQQQQGKEPQPQSQQSQSQQSQSQQSQSQQSLNRQPQSQQPQRKEQQPQSTVAEQETTFAESTAAEPTATSQEAAAAESAAAKQEAAAAKQQKVTGQSLNIADEATEIQKQTCASRGLVGLGYESSRPVDKKTI